MSYFKVLGFEKEPFSTSPDPEFFYHSREHETVLSNLLIELRLKRGMSVVLGNVGTGKTTLSRKLVQELKAREDFIFHVILNPSFENEQTFLVSLARNFGLDVLSENASPSLLDLRECFERFLFEKGVKEEKTVVLVVDEAQKINEQSLELLRVFLNYETNQFKLLQLILLGQLELYSTIMKMPNFLDRISFKFTLNPLDCGETKEMIDFRIRQAGYRAAMHLFSDDAVKEIHRHTSGYPRQITMFCHRALKSLVLKNKFVVDPEMV
ncbi:MAG: AAA family ATPase, partial [Candidatus Omnitrophica bacterium]|nr:AAA family ATPase [Candidatus Omnitrophota bacterium]